MIACRPPIDACLMTAAHPASGSYCDTVGARINFILGRIDVCNVRVTGTCHMWRQCMSAMYLRELVAPDLAVWVTRKKH